MNTATLYRATVLGVTWLAGYAGHETGDYLVQVDIDAQRKHEHIDPHKPSCPNDHRTPCQRVNDARTSLARHAISYGLTQAATKAAAYRVAGLRVPLAAQVAGTVAEIVLHAVIDDGRLLAWFAGATGKADHETQSGWFYAGDTAASGRSLIDQAVHKGLQVPIGAMVTAAVTAALAAKAGRGSGS